MIRRILRKDWALLWPMVALVTAIQAGLEWAAYRAGFFGADAAAVELLGPLTLAFYVGIAALSVAVIQQDPVPGVDQDWLIRPIRRSDLLLAKILFVILTISVPMFVLNFAHAVIAGFPLGLSLRVVLYKEFYLFVCMIVPLLALASLTRNMAELTVLGAALVVIYAVTIFAAALLVGVDRCPTCGSGLSWQQHLLQHAELLIGSTIVLLLQYFRRTTALCRALAIGGAVLLVVLQLPWNVAFGLQRQMLPPAAGHDFTLQFAPDAAGAIAAGDEAAAGKGGLRQTTRAILRGDIDKAIESLRRRGDAATPVSVDLPQILSGLAPGDRLLTDRSDLQIRDSNGHVIYVASSLDGAVGGVDSGESTSSAHQTVVVPRSVMTAARAGRLQLTIKNALTIVTPFATHEIASVKGRIRVADIGLCETRTDDYAVHLRCAQVGPEPFCFSATLYAPDGRHNPETTNCEPDYRPFLPPPSSVLNATGVDVHYRDPHGLTKYPIDASEIPDTHLVVRIYRARAHVQREAAVTLAPT